MRGPGIFALPTATVPRTAVESIPPAPTAAEIVSGGRSGGSRLGGGARLAGVTTVVSAAYAPAWSAQLVTAGGPEESEEFDADTDGDADSARHAVRSGAGAADLRSDDGTGGSPARTPRPKQERIVASPDAVPGASRIHASSPDERAAAQSAVTAATTDELPAARPPNSQPPGRSPAIPEEPTAPIDADAIRPPAAPGDPSQQLGALARQGAPSLSPPAAPSLSSIASGAGAFTRPEKPSPPKWRPPKASPKNGWGESMSGPLGTAAGPGGLGPGGTSGSTRGLSGFGGQTPGGGGGGEGGGAGGTVGPYGSSVQRDRWSKADAAKGALSEPADRSASAVRRRKEAEARATELKEKRARLKAAGYTDQQLSDLDAAIRKAHEEAQDARDKEAAANKEYKDLHTVYTTLSERATAADEGATAGERQRRKHREEREAAEDALRERRRDRRDAGRRGHFGRREDSLIESDAKRELDRLDYDMKIARKSRTPAEFKKWRLDYAAKLAEASRRNAAESAAAAEAEASAHARVMHALDHPLLGHTLPAAVAEQIATARATAEKADRAAILAEKTARMLRGIGDPKKNAAAKRAAKEARKAARDVRRAARNLRRALESGNSAKIRAASNALDKATKKCNEKTAAADKATQDATRAADAKAGVTTAQMPPDAAPPKGPLVPDPVSFQMPCILSFCRCPHPQLPCPPGTRCKCTLTLPEGKAKGPKATIPEGSALPTTASAPHPPDDVPRDAATTGPATTPSTAAPLSPSSHPSGSMKAVFPKDARTDKNAMDAKTPPMTVANPRDAAWRSARNRTKAWLVMIEELHGLSPEAQTAKLDLIKSELKKALAELDAQAKEMKERWERDFSVDDDYDPANRGRPEYQRAKDRLSDDMWEHAERQSKLHDLLHTAHSIAGALSDPSKPRVLNPQDPTVRDALERFGIETATELEDLVPGAPNDPWLDPAFRDVARRMGIEWEPTFGNDLEEYRRITRFVSHQAKLEGWAAWEEERRQAERSPQEYWTGWVLNYVRGFMFWSHWEEYSRLAANSSDPDTVLLATGGFMRTFLGAVFLPFWAVFGPILSNPHLSEDVVGLVAKAWSDAIDKFGKEHNLRPAQIQFLKDFLLFLFATIGVGSKRKGGGQKGPKELVQPEATTETTTTRLGTPVKSKGVDLGGKGQPSTTERPAGSTTTAGCEPCPVWRSITEAEANRRHVAKGLHKPYVGAAKEGVLTTAEDGWVHVWKDGKGSPQSGWYMRAKDIAGLTPEEIQAKWSLKYVPDRVADVTLNPGATIREGTAAGIDAFGTTGGGLQREFVSGTPSTVGPTRSLTSGGN
ncbi:MAG: hypothetical protein HMLKMBBP_03654 [Planctomycetes bacterium]|nr:hypothetical protein [Planctomycetota bacterium]